MAILTSYIIVACSAQFLILEGAIAAPCTPAQSCSECLIQGPNCTWCYKQDYPKEQRCDTVENHQRRGCEIGSVLNPVSKADPPEDDPVRNADPDKGLDAIQIYPQHIKLTLKPGRPVTVPITFRIAEDYPVDLYYIMDLSYSMLDDRENLIRLGEEIAKELKKITQDVWLGFGAFVDKAAMPFAGMRPESIVNPCYPKRVCNPMYGFKNQLSLTQNISIFGERVREAPISGNQDSPEGGMDALLQAMVCEPQIGWRSNSRKIVLFSTDAQSHISGDAKLAGIVEPNDGFCHLHENEYTYSLRQDYPSVSQIASVASLTSTNVIFAVSNYLEEYEAIAKLIPNSVVGQLANDSGNIVDLVREQYDSLIKTVKLTSSYSGADINVTISASNCGDKKPVEGSVCDAVSIGQEVMFEATISLTGCTSSAPRRFVIKPQDLADSLEVEVEVECSCSCGDEEADSDQCSSAGTYHCGICSCNDGLTGDHCECDEQTAKSPTACLNPLTNVTCSGHGECDNCGFCLCDCLPGESEPSCTRYSRPFCQCNTKACDQADGLVCAGNGQCVCDGYTSESYCRCDNGFTGEDCSCPVSTDGCRAENSSSSLVCNGKGQCYCGECQCTDACYEGKTCDFLKPECSSACIDFKECVICQVKPEEVIGCSDDVCSGFDIRRTQSMDVKDACFYVDQDNCQHFYTFEYNHINDSWYVNILQEPRCLKDYWLELIIGLCVGVFLIGLIAIIIWKIVVTIHDKREFAKFEKEALKAQWKSTHNPIYQPATSTFRNPMYTGASQKPEQL